MKTRTKTCKNCSERFAPRFTTLEKFCWKPECKTKEAMLNLEKQKAKQQREQKRQTQEKKLNLRTASQWRQITQKTFNIFVRARDQDQPCISCGQQPKAKRDAGHFFSVGNYPALRYEPTNCHAQCVECNHHKGGNLHEYKIRLIAKVGQEEVDRLTEIRNEPKKYTIPELKELNIYYLKKIQELNKKND